MRFRLSACAISSDVTFAPIVSIPNRELDAFPLHESIGDAWINVVSIPNRELDAFPRIQSNSFLKVNFVSIPNRELDAFPLL